MFYLNFLTRIAWANQWWDLDPPKYFAPDLDTSAKLEYPIKVGQDTNILVIVYF